MRQFRAGCTLLGRRLSDRQFIAGSQNRRGQMALFRVAHRQVGVLTLKQFLRRGKLPDLKAVLGRQIKLTPKVHQQTEPRQRHIVVQALSRKLFQELLLDYLADDSLKRLLFHWPEMRGRVIDAQ